MRSKTTEATISLPNLLVDGSDAEFRELIALLYATSGRLQAMRRELAKACIQFTDALCSRPSEEHEYFYPLHCI